MYISRYFHEILLTVKTILLPGCSGKIFARKGKVIFLGLRNKKKKIKIKIVAFLFYFFSTQDYVEM